jgi:hypothetical protein
MIEVPALGPYSSDPIALPMQSNLGANPDSAGSRSDAESSGHAWLRARGKGPRLP